MLKKLYQNTQDIFVCDFFKILIYYMNMDSLFSCCV